MLNMDDNKLSWIFGVPLLSILWPDVGDLNRRLSQLILGKERCERGTQHSNVGGWQSDCNLDTWSNPAVTSLLEMINQGVAQLSTQISEESQSCGGVPGWSVCAWANVNRRGNFNVVHHHNGSGRAFWAGVYYVEVGRYTSSQGGALVLRSTSADAQIANLTRAPESLRKRFKHEVTIQPVPGLLLIFPSWLEHWVTPHSSEEPRVSVAFNILLQVPQPESCETGLRVS